MSELPTNISSMIQNFKQIQKERCNYLDMCKAFDHDLLIVIVTSTVASSVDVPCIFFIDRGTDHYYLFNCCCFEQSQKFF